MNTKRCAHCREEKLVSEFYKNYRNKDGFQTYCKSCAKKIAALYLKTDKGKASIKKYHSHLDANGYYRHGKGAINILKQGAKKRGISFDLTEESLLHWWDSTPDKCFYCGITIDEYMEIKNFIVNYNGNNYEISKFKRFYRAPSHQAIRWMTIDRVENNLGYSVNNIVKSCWICNSTKSDFFDAEHMSVISPKIMSRLKSEIAKEFE